mgnify:CR=1 FL=1|tara:strand:- start:1563 stop:1838 length:276 start_codon:yes stop_codon:yes gene_type:complete
MSFKIPRFLSKGFNSRKGVERTKYVEKYKQWYDQEITQDFIEGLGRRLEELVQEEEKMHPTTEFEFKYQTVSSRAERLLIRGLIKEMNYKV